MRIGVVFHGGGCGRECPLEICPRLPSRCRTLRTEVDGMTIRLQGLDQDASAQAQRVAKALAAGKVRDAGALLQPLHERFPEHPEVLHLQSGVRARMGDLAGALQAVRQALEQRPDEAVYHCTLGNQLAASGDVDAAIDAFRHACELQPALAMAWCNLGILLVRNVRLEEAEQALRKAVELDPAAVQARLQLADLLKLQGRPEAAADEFRRMLETRPALGEAWWGLANLKSLRFSEDDVKRMQTVLRDAGVGDAEKIPVAFALARALDETGRYADALRVLAQAHLVVRRAQPWNALGFRKGLDAILAAFTPPPAHAAPGQLGQGAIFIVGLPRSGSTLVEQILASHSQVRGSGELNDLPRVLAEESAQRKAHYPEWVPTLQPDDWRRLGERYLERTARWRQGKPCFTDKLPGNWMHVGAIRAMLPGARVIVCRRDPLETCLACYRQRFTTTGLGWTHRFEDLAAQWIDFDRAVRLWRSQSPDSVFEHFLEALIADAESSVRALLAFCGLPFEEACLEFHRNPREVASPSAMQVREPLQHDTARARHYGALLDPLRRALGMVDIMSYFH
jgi:tetratricopeptide (TPR) repeat protein